MDFFRQAQASTRVYVASQSPVKLGAVQRALDNTFDSSTFTVIGEKSESRVSEQPMSKKEIVTGALNRLDSISGQPCVSIETGVFERPQQGWFEVSYAILATRHGRFQAWSEEIRHDDESVRGFLERKDTEEAEAKTIEEFEHPLKNVYDRAGKTRLDVLCQAVEDLLSQAKAASEILCHELVPRTECDVSFVAGDAAVVANLSVIGAPLVPFKGISFLDIQTPLASNVRRLTKGLVSLLKGVGYDTLLLIDSRGFLFSGVATLENKRVVLARKPSKLPGELVSVQYDLEYGKDELCVGKGFIEPGSRVVVMDDVVATGGTMRAAESLVRACGATVVAFAAPWAIRNDGVMLCQDAGIISRLRFLFTVEESSAVRTSGKCFEGSRPSVFREAGEAGVHWCVVSHYSTLAWAVGLPLADVRWNQYGDSDGSRVSFRTSDFKGKHVVVLMDPSNTAETLDILQLLSILHRKDPLSVKVVTPFFGQSTQDRIEYMDHSGRETLAQMDTVSKLCGTLATVVTFDLHALQSQFLFHDCRVYSLVKLLFAQHLKEYPDVVVVYPDQGAQKRFHSILPAGLPYVIFQKVRKGDERVVTIVEQDGVVATARNFVIVDDLVRTGGTIVAVAKEIKKLWKEAHVAAVFAHCPLSPGVRIAGFEEWVDEVRTTDSCPDKVPSHWVTLRLCKVLPELLSSMM